MKARRTPFPLVFGGIVEADHAPHAALMDTMRRMIRERNKTLDVQRGFCNSPFTMPNEGPAMNQKFVSYVRVSTAKQGRSGLGLEGQQAAVAEFVSAKGGKLLREYREVESGKNPERPELAKALAHAKRAGAVLLVAKLDRLSRNVHFLSGLLEAGVDFVAADNPVANRFTLHVLAALAEEEARAVSVRTKAALEAAKARGAKLGSARPGHWEGREDRRAEGQARATKRAARVNRAKAREAYTDLFPLMLEMREAGASLREIAETLNTQGHTTRRGKAWTAVQVMRILARAE